MEKLAQYKDRQTFGSIQETVQKTKEPMKIVERMMDKGYYDFNEANLYRGLSDANKVKLFETLRTIPFDELIRKVPIDDINCTSHRMREFLAQSGTSGIAGAAYLVPQKIYQIMFDSAVAADLTSDISITVIPAEQIPGSTLKVDIAKDDSYKPKKFSSGGVAPSEEIQTVQATLDFGTIWIINFQIGNDLIEDAQFDLVEIHLRNAGREMGEYATDETVGIMASSTDGDGTLNTESGGGNTTTFTDVYNAVDANLQDGYVSDRFLTSHHQIKDSISQDTTYTQDATGFRDHLVTEAYPKRLLGMDVLYSEVSYLTESQSTGTAYEDLDSYVFSKDFSVLSGRKRWLRIEKYSQPISDLVGAAITCRQDSVTVYNDSICRIRET